MIEVDTVIEIKQPGSQRLQLDLDTFLGALRDARERKDPPFSATRLARIAAISDAVRMPGGTAAPPALIHFAFWIRRAALTALRTQFNSGLPQGCIARPRGLVLHLPPQNVETVFLYSWVLAYLAGNANVTRLPSRISAEISRVLDIVLDHIQDPGESSQFFVHYPSDRRINAAVSNLCDARLVWGGDAKIAEFSSLPLRQGGKSLWFGDRRSLCVLDGEALNALDQAGRNQLIMALYNDIFVFDQLACSSPQILFVVGDRLRHDATVFRLLKDLAAFAEAQGYQATPAQELKKLTEAMALSANADCDRFERFNSRLTVIESQRERQGAPVGGGFLEIQFKNGLGDLAGHVIERDQTLTYFGFRIEELTAFADRALCAGISRIVPVGRALDFDALWDGYDIPRELVNLTNIR